MTLSVKELHTKLGRLIESAPDALVVVGQTHTDDYVSIELAVKTGMASSEIGQHRIVIIDVLKKSEVLDLDTVLTQL
jgi:arginine deiminase